MALIFTKSLSANLAKKVRVPFIFLMLFLSSNQLLAQKDSVEKIIAFKITDYIKPLSDSTVVVQVIMPAIPGRYQKHLPPGWQEERQQLLKINLRFFTIS